MPVGRVSPVGRAGPAPFFDPRVGRPSVQCRHERLCRRHQRRQHLDAHHGTPTSAPGRRARCDVATNRLSARASRGVLQLSQSGFKPDLPELVRHRHRGLVVVSNRDAGTVIHRELATGPADLRSERVRVVEDYRRRGGGLSCDLGNFNRKRLPRLLARFRGAVPRLTRSD
jgi:hypothetical protein